MDLDSVLEEKPINERHRVYSPQKQVSAVGARLSYGRVT